MKALIQSFSEFTVHKFFFFSHVPRALIPKGYLENSCQEWESLLQKILWWMDKPILHSEVLEQANHGKVVNWNRDTILFNHQ